MSTAASGAVPAGNVNKATVSWQKKKRRPSDVQSDVSADMCVTGMHGIAANSYLWSWIVGMLSSDNPFGEMPKRFSFGRSYTLSAWSRKFLCLHRYVELLVLGSRWIPK